MIPKYDEVMLPLLKFLSDANEHSVKEVTDFLANLFKKDPYYQMTDEELREMLPSGQQRIFESRVGWARTYLKKAGLIDSPKRGIIKITKRGLELLNENPEKIDNDLLLQFPEFREFINKSRGSIQSQASTDENFKMSPDEQLESAYKLMNESLIQEIAEKIKNIDFRTFEKLVIDVLLKMGYGGDLEDAGKVIGKSGDEGIDGMIKQDPLGLDNVYVQAKRWNDTTVGRPEIQKFVGALHGKGATKGIFITSSQFSSDAFEYVKTLTGIKVILIDGRELAEKMIKYNVGVSTVKTFELKRIDYDYFED